MPLRWQDGWPFRPYRSSHKMPWNSIWAIYLLIAVLAALVNAMTPKRIGELRQETVAMFYHGFDNYMKIAFPEDEVCFSAQIKLISCILTFSIAQAGFLCSINSRPTKPT